MAPLSDVEDDEPMLTGMRIREEDSSSLEGLFRLFREELRAPLVKQEPKEDAGGKEHVASKEDEPRSMDSQQIQLIKRMMRGVRRFDPAQDPNAEYMFQHLMQDMDVE